MEMNYRIPETMEMEHEQLHDELKKAIASGGKTGKTAKALATVLHPHFVKEEDFALPPLGLLPSLSKGRVTSDMRDILLMTDKLTADLNQMLKEHEEIVQALKKLVTEARKERKVECLHFADRLTRHAKTEEEIFYPAAMLIGRYLKLRLSGTDAKTLRKPSPTNRAR
jgi:hypothetical protein